MKKKMRAIASQAKFSIGFSPKIAKNPQDNTKWFIPEPYKSVCLISADFELAWASRYTKRVTNPLEKAINDGYLTRENVPKILDLCDKYDIPITWATVGHLFLESCAKENGVKHPDISRLPYFENIGWKFDSGDWFDYDPCTDYKNDPAWYSPDLIKDILSRKVKHEIGCHTFSHIDCRDGLDEGVALSAELDKCEKIAGEWGLKLTSFVHPGYTIGNIKLLADSGYDNFRTNYRNVLGVPIYHEEGIWEFEQTAEFEIRKEWSIKWQRHRFKEIIRRAIKHNRLCVLWFHPSMSPQFVSEVMPHVFEFLNDKKEEILTISHTEYVEYLKKMNR